jgi:transposase-like protein
MKQMMLLEPGDIQALRAGDTLTVRFPDGTEVLLGYAGAGASQNGHRPGGPAVQTAPEPPRVGAKLRRKSPSPRRWPDATKETARARVQAGERQVDVARDLGISSSLISQWVNGYKDKRRGKKYQRLPKEAAEGVRTVGSDGRRYFTEEHWKSLTDQYMREGGSVGQFIKRHGVVETAFRRHLKMYHSRTESIPAVKKLTS